VLASDDLGFVDQFHLQAAEEALDHGVVPADTSLLQCSLVVGAGVLGWLPHSAWCSRPRVGSPHETTSPADSKALLAHQPRYPLPGHVPASYSQCRMHPRAAVAASALLVHGGHLKKVGIKRLD